jgi:hypothetical protein
MLINEADPQGHTAWLLAHGLEQAAQLSTRLVGTYDSSGRPGV